MDNLRVLLVEDDDDNRELMAEVLAASGFEVLSAASGQDGLKALSEHSVDVVVTDVGMPGMGGIEMAKAAKQIAPTVPVVVVTGWAERDDITNARGKHVDAVLIKPVDPEALSQAVSDVARGRGRAEDTRRADSGIEPGARRDRPMADAVTSVKDVFEKHMPGRLQAKPDVVAKINAVYQFNISGPGGGSWWVDCTQPGGRVQAGSAPNARCTVAAVDLDFLNIVNGKLNAQMAFMSGKLKIQGDMGLAMKLQQIL